MAELSTLGDVIKTAYEGESNTNAFTDAEKSKLSQIEAGAQANLVDSVNGQTGEVTLSAGDVGALPDSYSPPTVTTTADGLMLSSDKVKLNGIAENATANASDAELRDRATHTGVQDMSTITGLEAALEDKATTAALALLDARVAALEAATPEE